MKESEIKNLFTILNNNPLDKSDIQLEESYKKGYFPYFTRSILNNGEIGYVQNIPTGYEIDGNSIAVGLMGMRFFYKEQNFCAGQFTKTLKPTFDNFNSDIALYFCTYLNTYQDLLKANLVRDFNKLVGDINVPFDNKQIDMVETFISAIKKLVIKDLIEWKNNMISSLKLCVNY